jgi:hypothetical protein
MSCRSRRGGNIAVGEDIGGPADLAPAFASLRSGRAEAVKDNQNDAADAPEIGEREIFGLSYRSRVLAALPPGFGTSCAAVGFSRKVQGR